MAAAASFPPMSSFRDGMLNGFSTALLHTPNLILNNKDSPGYFASGPSILQSHAEPISVTIGTGGDIYSRHAESLLATKQELIIVTCFWARSKSLDTLKNVLRNLSAQVLANSNRQKIRVRICFSSLSLTQKLLHPRSLSGKPWPSSTWVSKLGLPAPSELTGLDLQIKSIFVLPFSVMHPKFIIIDRHTVLLPSCNVSWEDWLEGCLMLSGDVVGQFTRFYGAFWSDSNDTNAPPAPSALAHPVSASASPSSTPSIFLPSPHHANPHFNPVPFTFSPSPPPTPLNTFLLTSIDHAQSSITITTPNLTCQPLISALLTSLTHGVNVTIYTSRRMMLLEQLLTAGTATEIYVWWMRRRYRKLLKQRRRLSSREGEDIEANHHLGELKIYYFAPNATRDGSERCKANKLHFKSTIIDDHIVVLGSGNMDRTSWYTSQEVGVAFASRELAGLVQREFQGFLTKPDGGKYLEQTI